MIRFFSMFQFFFRIFYFWYLLYLKINFEIYFTPYSCYFVYNFTPNFILFYFILFIRLELIESIIDQFSLKIKTVLTVLPENNRFQSNLNLLSPHIKFTEKVLNRLKFNSEIIPTKTKSTIIEILNLKTNLENGNFNNVENEEENIQKNFLLQTRSSLKDFVFLFSTFNQLLIAQKKENLVEIISLKVRKIKKRKKNYK